MKTYINQELANDFISWLDHKLKCIPQLEPYYRSDDRSDFHSLFNPAYPLTIHVARKLPNGSYLPDIKAVFILEQVGGRLKVGIKCVKSLAIDLLPILREMIEDFPETTKDIQPQINRVECEQAGSTEMSSHKEVEPWDKIENKIWDRAALKLWWSDYSCPEIGVKISVSARRVTNRLCELRKIYGKEIVPLECDRRRLRHRVI